MSVATSTAIGLGIAGAGIAGSVATGVIGANAAGNAAQTQSNTALQVAQLQSQDANKALGFQEQQYNNNLNLLEPWVQSGQGAMANLDYLMGIGPQGYTTPGANSVSPIAGGMNNTAAGQAIRGGSGGQSQLPFGPNVTQVNSPYTSPGATNVPMSAGAGVRTAGGQANRLQTLPAGGATGANTYIPSVAASNAAGGSLASGVQNVPQANLGSMVNPSLGGYGSLMQGWNQTFQAPTAITEQNDPGYQARLQLGEQTLDRSAAARGGLLTGGTMQNENQLAQDYASNEYGNVYNRAYNNYATNYNQYEQNQTNQYNRLASIAGLGQTSAGQLGQLGNSASSGIANTLLTSGAQQGQDLNNAAAARASGYIGAGNAYSGMASGLTGSASNALLLSQLLGGGGQTIYPSSLDSGAAMA